MVLKNVKFPRKLIRRQKQVSYTVINKLCYSTISSPTSPYSMLVFKHLCCRVLSAYLGSILTGEGGAKHEMVRFESRSQKSALTEFLWFQDFNLEFSFLEDFCPMDPTPNTFYNRTIYFFQKTGNKNYLFSTFVPKIGHSQ